MRRAWIVAAVVAGAFALPSGAQAQLTVGGHAGYGAGLNFNPDPYRGMVGVRGGWNFDEFYIGAHSTFYSGDRISGRLGDTTFRQMQVLSIDAGYDIDLKKLLLRPVFGIGGTAALYTVAGQNRNEGAAFINFGAEALSKLIKNRVFLGGGIRITSTFFEVNNVNAFSFYLIAGTRFDFRGDGEGIPTGAARKAREAEEAPPPAAKPKRRINEDNDHITPQADPEGGMTGTESESSGHTDQAA